MPELILYHQNRESSSVEVDAGTTLTVSTPVTGFRGEPVSHTVRSFSFEDVVQVELTDTVSPEPQHQPGAEPAEVVQEPPAAEPVEAHESRPRRKPKAA